MTSTNIEIEIIKEKLASYKEVIGVIGTGSFGIALGKRLIDYGFRVVYGSREPNYEYVRGCLNIEESENQQEKLLSVASVADAWLEADNVVFLAVSAKNEVYEKIVNEFIQAVKSKNSPDYGSGKILVDVSNLTERENRSQKSRLLQTWVMQIDQFKCYQCICIGNLYTLYRKNPNLVTATNFDFLGALKP